MTISDAGTIAEISWRVARRCNAGDCVSLAPLGNRILIGDSKTPDGPVLTYSRAEWKEFLEGVRKGDFDDLCNEVCV